MDLERVILTPIFSSLILIASSGTYRYLIEHSFSDMTSTLHLVYKGLTIAFYFLVVALFFMRSQARATSRSLLARILAYAGTFTPFLLILTKSPETGPTFPLLSVSIMTCGLLFAIYSLKTLGRSFGIIPQARALVRNGPYRLIRHPLYVGEVVAFGGIILNGFTISKLGIFLLLAAIESYRAIQEEKILEETIAEYSMYKAATKRFIPGVI